MLIRTKTVLISALLTAAPLAIAVTAASQANAAGESYSSCDALQRDWPNGVAKSKTAAKTQVRQGNSRPASGPKARGVYRTNNSNLDRDKDGTACEN